MKKKFATHGQYKISLEGNIVIIEAEGPWNDEFFLNMHHSLAEKVGQLGSDIYALLVVLKGEAVATYDSIEVHNKYVRAGNTKAIAISLEFCDTPSTAKDLFQRVYEENKLLHQFFSESASAKEWLLPFVAQ